MPKLKRSYENVIMILFLLPLIYFFHKPNDFFNDNSLLFFFIVGVIISIIGIFIRVWARHFKSNTKGSLAEDSLYGYTRNPMYVASFLVGLGLSFAICNLWLILGYSFVFILMHHLIILREEKYLKNTYGQSYIDYMEKVPRWIPKFSSKVKSSINSQTDISLRNIFNAFIKEGNPIFGNILLFLLIVFTARFKHGFFLDTKEYVALACIVCLWIIFEITLILIKNKAKRVQKSV